MLKIGLVGLGGIARVHARHYQRMDVEVVGFDVDPQRSEEFAINHGIRVGQSLEAVLQECDAVDLCIPTNHHFHVAMKAVAAGRAVLLEKPVTLTVAEGMELIEAAEKNNVKVMAAQVVRYFPEFETAHKRVASGDIGTIAVARMSRWGRTPQGADGWFSDLNRSGGILLDLAVHEFDWLNWTLGEVKSVYARQATLQQEPRDWIGDYAVTTLTFASGAIAHVESSWMSPSGFRVAFEVCGSNGMIEHDGRKTSALSVHTAGKSENQSPMSTDDDPYYRELSAFVHAVAHDQPVPIPLIEGVKAVSVARAAIKSAQTGEPVTPERP